MGGIRMFLYNKLDNHVEVFSLTRDEDKIRKYRIEQMKNIPFDKRCLYSEEVVASYDDNPLLAKTDLDLNIILESDLVGEGKVLGYNTDSDDCVDLLERFYIDKYLKRPIARVDALRDLRYLLIAADYVNTRKNGSKIIMRIEDIIELPKSLYLLQLFEQEKFGIIGDEDLSSQLALFNFQSLNKISLDELKKMDEACITDEAYQRVIAKCENDKPILKQLIK